MHYFLLVGEGRAGGIRNCRRMKKCASESLCAERFSDSASGAMITFHDTKRSFDAVEIRSLLRNRKQPCPDRIGKTSNAKGKVNDNLVQYKDIARRQGTVFNNSIKWLMLCMSLD